MKKQPPTERRQVITEVLYHLSILTTDSQAHQWACTPHHKQHIDTICHLLVLDTHSLPVQPFPTETSHPHSRSVHIYRNTEDQCLVLCKHIDVFLILIILVSIFPQMTISRPQIRTSFDAWAVHWKLKVSTVSSNWRLLLFFIFINTCCILDVYNIAWFIYVLNWH